MRWAVVVVFFGVGRFPFAGRVVEAWRLVAVADRVVESLFLWIRLDGLRPDEHPMRRFSPRVEEDDRQAALPEHPGQRDQTGNDISTPELTQEQRLDMMEADLELIGLEAPGDGKKIVEDKFDDWHNWEDQVVSMGR